MHKALRSLPWVRKAKVDFEGRTARVVVEKRSYQPEKLVAALEKAGFGGRVRTRHGDRAHQNPQVTFHVIGMRKTKSGAT